MPFRLEHITLADRMVLGCQCLLFAGQYGFITGLAHDYGTSRQFFYDLRGKAQNALEIALAPGTPGRSVSAHQLEIDRALLDRAVVVLNQVAHASVRGIQECLLEILEVKRSIGAIHGVLVEAAGRAKSLSLVPGRPVQAVADEIFAAGRPILEVVDHRSAAVLALEGAPNRDETAWGCTMLDLLAQGVAISNSISDGAEGLRSGLRAAGLPEPRLDHWHTLRDLGRLGHILEGEAYRRLEEAERAQRAAAAEAYRLAHGHRAGRGRPLKVASDPLSVQQAIQESEVAIRRADGAVIVLAAVREALRPVDGHSGRPHRPQESKSELEAAAALLHELGGRAVEIASILEQRGERLIAYLVELEAALQGPRERLGEEVVALLGWAWQHREGLGLGDAGEAWPQDAQTARAVWAALEGAVRATGMAENLNSVLAFHRAAHRGLPDNVLAVFEVYRNHRVFPRGKRAGHSPFALMDIPSPHWLDALGYGRSQAKSSHEFPIRPTESVNTLAA
jgi:hypothetical protein